MSVAALTLFKIAAHSSDNSLGGPGSVAAELQAAVADAPAAGGAVAAASAAAVARAAGAVAAAATGAAAAVGAAAAAAAVRGAATPFIFLGVPVDDSRSIKDSAKEVKGGGAACSSCCTCCSGKESGSKCCSTKASAQETEKETGDSREDEARRQSLQTKQTKQIN